VTYIQVYQREETSPIAETTARIYPEAVDPDPPTITGVAAI
jgi:hypothetical protein